MVNSETLLVLELKDFFFDGILTDEAENEDVVLLAYAMSATHGLVLDCGIPPVIKENDTVGRGEVKTKAASLQANQKYGNTIIGLELMDRGGAIAGVAIEGNKANALLKQELLHLG